MHAKPLTRCAAICATLTILTSCSTPPAGSETEAEKFRQLRADLPTASRQDTEQTRTEVGRFRALFFALCPEVVCGEGPGR